MFVLSPEKKPDLPTAKIFVWTVYEKPPKRRNLSLAQVQLVVCLRFRVGTYPSLYAAIDPISSLSDEDKVSLLQRVDQIARAEDPRVQEVNVRISGNHETMMVMASDGTLAADIRPLVRFDVSVIVEHNGRRERGNAGGGGRRSLESLSRRRMDG